MGRGELGDFLADGGAVVGGAAAIGTVIGFAVGSVAHELDPKHDPDTWARRSGLACGLIGLWVVINGL